MPRLVCAPPSVCMILPPPSPQPTPSPPYLLDHPPPYAPYPPPLTPPPLPPPPTRTGLWCTGEGNLFLRPVLWCTGEENVSLHPVVWCTGEGNLSLCPVLWCTGEGNLSLRPVLWCTGKGSLSLLPVLCCKEEGNSLRPVQSCTGERAWLRCGCSARVAARHGQQVLPCVRRNLSAAVAPPWPLGGNGARLAAMQQQSQSCNNTPGALAAVRVLQPGCSYCSTPIAPRLVMGWGLAIEAQHPLYPPPCAGVHRGGGPILPPFAGMHMCGARPSTLS